MRKTTLVLLGNYPPDQQWSMRFCADLLREAAIAKDWEVHDWQPPVLFGRWGNPHRGLGKINAYIDKYLVAPRRLAQVIKRHPETVFHLADHANAPYLQVLPPVRTLMTCHDAIALRRARGDFSGNPPSRLFRQQQAYIRRGMQQIQSVVYDSELTKLDYIELFQKQVWQKGSVIHLPLPQQLPQAKDIRSPTVRQNEPFILHHSSNSFYKNRPFVGDIFIHIAKTFPHLQMVFSGNSLPSTMRADLQKAGLMPRVHDLGHVENTTLAALYQQAAAVLFPSLIEGYGWPPLEAVSVGAVVIASPTGVLPELLDPPTIRYAAPDDLSGWVQHLKTILTHPDEAARMRATARATPLPTRTSFAEAMHAQWQALLPTASPHAS